MRIAVFTDTDFDRTGGAASALGALVEHAPADVHPRIYTFADLEVEEPNYVALRRTRLIRWRRLALRLTDEGVRALHLTGAGPAGLVARGLASHLGLPLLGSVHAPIEPRAFERWLYRGCARVLMPSAFAARATAACGWIGARSMVWPRGVDAALFSPSRRSAHLREAWHVSDRRPALLVAGRLSVEDGAAIVEALSASLHHRRISHRLIVLSDGPPTRGLRDRCPDAYITGRLSRLEVAAAMASADLLVCPTPTDSGCSVLLEAQASGVPVLVTTAGSARENMRQARTGYACPAGDVGDLADRAATLLVDRDHRREMGGAARLYAVGRSWDASLGPIYDLYRAAGDRRLGAAGAPDVPGPSTWRGARATALALLRHRRWAGHR
jgi:glycosyltransferase involved in cell wall biosynthesis